MVCRLTRGHTSKLTPAERAHCSPLMFPQTSSLTPLTSTVPACGYHSEPSSSAREAGTEFGGGTGSLGEPGLHVLSRLPAEASQRPHGSGQVGICALPAHMGAFLAGRPAPSWGTFLRAKTSPDVLSML